MTSLKHLLIHYKLLFFLALITSITLIVAACNGAVTGTGTHATTPTPTQQEVSANPTIDRTTPEPTQASSTPGSATATATVSTGPHVILTPTPLPGGNGHSQIVTLADRTLTIQNITMQNGSDGQSVDIGLVMLVNDTGSKTIQNQSTFYQLVSSGGDVFGLQLSATASFFGTIAPHSARSGTVVFQVPTAAVSGLRLLFSPEISKEAVFVPLQIS